MTDIMDAYIKGRMAAKSHLSKQQLDADAERPPNPYAKNWQLESIEWNRGFQEVIAQGNHGAPRSIPSESTDEIGDDEASALDEELELD